MESGRLDELVGYRAVGRYGELGVVIRTELGDRTDSAAIVVRGGTSQALLFEIPAARLTRIVRARRTVIVDADVADFVPRLTRDGEVELRLGR